MINLDLSFVIQLINFLVLVLILNAFLYKPLRKVLADRGEQLSGARATAEQVDRDVQEKMAQYESRLREIKSSASEERAARIKEAHAEESALVEKSRSEAAASLAGIKSRVAAEAAAARELLKVQSRELSLQICEKVLGRSL